MSNFTSPGGQNVTHQISGGLTYAWSPTLSLNGFFSYSRLILSQATDTETYNPTAGFSYAYNPTLFLSASAGVYINRPLQVSVGNNKSTSIGPTFNLTAAKTFEHATLTLTASQGITTSAGVAGVSQTRAVSLAYARTLTQYLNGSIATSYSNFDTGLTSFQVFQLYASLSYPVWRYINAGLSYNYQLERFQPDGTRPHHGRHRRREHRSALHQRVISGMAGESVNGRTHGSYARLTNTPSHLTPTLSCKADRYLPLLDTVYAEGVAYA